MINGANYPEYFRSALFGDIKNKWRLFAGKNKKMWKIFG